MANSVVQTIRDAEVDARSLSEFMYDPADVMVARRLAPSIHSLQYYLNFLNSIPSIIQGAIDTTVIESSPVSDALVSVDGSLSQRTINRGLESVADLSTINNPKDGLRVYVKSYHAGLGKGGGYFIYDSNEKKWLREFNDYITSDDLGFVQNEDNTQKWLDIEPYLKDGDTLHIKSGDYMCSFVTKKAVNFITDGDVTILQPHDKPALKIYQDWVEHNVVGSNIGYGATQVTLLGDVDVKKGSLITLWNGFKRDPANPVNYETLEVDSVGKSGSNTVVELVDAVQSYQKGSNIKAYVCAEPHEGVIVDIKGKIVNSTDHWQPAVHLNGIKKLRVKSIETQGTQAHALRIEQCLDYDIESGVKFTDAYSAGSGAGYGLTNYKSSKGRIGVVYGRNMRHDVDNTSSYNIKIAGQESVNPFSSVCALSHNGFCGDISCGYVNVTISKYSGDYLVGASTSNQGYTGDITQAEHPMRSISVGDITINVTDPNADGASEILGFNFVGDYDEINIGKIKMTFANATMAPSTTKTRGVLVQGLGNIVNLEGIQSNVLGSVAIFRNEVGGKRPQIKIGDIDVAMSNYFVYSRGCDIYANKLIYSDVKRKQAIEIADMTSVGGLNTRSVHVGFMQEQVATASVTPVASPVLYRDLILNYSSMFMGTAVTVSDGAVLTDLDILTKNGIVVLGTPAASSSSTIDISIPDPLAYTGQKLTLKNSQSSLSDRATVNITGSNVIEVLTIKSGETLSLISYAGQWRKL